MSALVAIANAVGVIGAALGPAGAGLKGVVTITRTTPGTFDPANNTRTAPTTLTVTRPASATDKPGDAPGNAVVERADGTHAVRLRRRLSVTARDAEGTPMPFDPAPGDLATWEGAEWTVFGCVPVRPDGVTAVSYAVDVERAP